MVTRGRVRQVAGAAAEPSRELEVVSGVLARLEKEMFACPYLQRIQDDLKDETRPASAAIARLLQLIRLKDTSLNLLFAPIAAVAMWDFHFARAIDRWRVAHGSAIERWLSGVGRLEALCALASYAFEHPKNPFPTIVDSGPVFRGQRLGHPLLPEETCVRNTITLDASNRLLIVSGSNMSGKSFLLRTVGINAILACAGAPVCADALTVSPLMVGATLNVHDSIQAGVSRFYAEIKRIRMLMDISHGPTPLLFLLDEIMHGTNSWDRRIGASAILRGFLQAGAIGITTTHDLAITELTGEFGASSQNAHLEDQLKDGQLEFDYLLRPGVVTRSNALDLMRAIGLNVD
jgi:DNA mismatch repair ATPase MutS